MLRLGSNHGFTLLEVLIAISIFSIIGVGSHILLSTVIDVKDSTDVQAKQLGELQTTFTLMKQDLIQVKPQAGKDANGGDIRSFQIDDITYSLSFIRGGWPNPLEFKRSDLLGISYAIESNSESNGTDLIRYSWPLQDTVKDDLAMDEEERWIRQVLSKNITELYIRFMDDGLQWSDDWVKPVIDEDFSNHAVRTFPLPLAIEVTLIHGEYGEISQVINMPRGLPELQKMVANEI